MGRGNLRHGSMGELRRTDRVEKRALAIAENPSASRPERMRTWAGTLAASRFVENPDVTHEPIMLPHRMTTHEEVLQHDRVLLAVDTTESNLSSHETVEGLGPIGRGNKAHGFFVHPVLAMDADAPQLPGCIDQEPLVRHPALTGEDQGPTAKACARVADVGA
jgi:hypothetical protein